MEENSHGGARKGAGRKSKAEMERVNEVFLAMIKTVENVETDEEAKQALSKQLYTFERGQMFIAEHIFGKPKEIKETTIFDGSDMVKISFGSNKNDNI